MAASLAAAVVVLVLGGASAALALLPSDLRDAPADRRAEAPPRLSLTARVMPTPVLPPAATPPTLRVAAAAAAPSPAKARRAGADYYRRTVARRVPASATSDFMALYRESARTFGVSWRLIASIHRQETAFSTAPGTYRGLNAFGCCAGPMQFNVTNGPVSTWDSYKQSFKVGDRPKSYPNRATFHPSIYDDFDAIMAAGALLRDSGATPELGGGSWSAAYAYYGQDLFGITYASQVLGRARGWELRGFCPNCDDDAGLVAAFDDAYGVDARRRLLAAEATGADAAKRKRAKARRRAAARRKRSEARRKAAADPGRRGPARPSRSGRGRAPAAAAGQPKPKPDAQPSPSPGPTGPTGPATGPTPPGSGPAAVDPACSGLDGLTGCSG